jgi:hypothetical protein
VPLHHQEPEGDDRGCYITDLVCEIFCGPAVIGKEVEFTFQWIGDPETQTPEKRKCVVRTEADLGCDVVCPSDIQQDHTVALGMRPTLHTRFNIVNKLQMLNSIRPQLAQSLPVTCNSNQWIHQRRYCTMRLRAVPNSISSSPLHWQRQLYPQGNRQST